MSSHLLQDRVGISTAPVTQSCLLATGKGTLQSAEDLFKGVDPLGWSKRRHCKKLAWPISVSTEGSGREWLAVHEHPLGQNSSALVLDEPANVL